MLSYSCSNDIKIQKQMLTQRTRHREQSLISCLNHLESIKIKIPRLQKHKNEIEKDLAFVIDSIKEYMIQAKNETIMFKDLQREVERLKEEKAYMSDKHNQILEALEILIYQGDHQEMKRKVHYYKAKPLDESFLTFVTQEISQNGSTLNRAFVMDSEEEKGYSEFSHLEDQNTEKIVEEQIEKVRLESALKIVKNQDQPFEKRQQAWLRIVYSRNAKEQSELFNSENILNSCSSRNLQSFSEISLTQQCQRYSKEKHKDLMTFSGKKIKSMALLKEKSNKKKSIPKTSVKKSIETHREMENAEGSEQKLLKRKLNFAQKTNEKDSKKKSFKNQQNLIAKSFKKQPQNHN